MNQQWKQNYLKLKSGLSDYQIDILKNGPKSLSQAWALQAMKYDWVRMGGQK